jgi:hypothetical protein
VPAARSAALRRPPAPARPRKRKTPEALPRYRELGLQLMADIAGGVRPIGSFLPPE